MDNAAAVRKNPRLREYDYSGAGCYFLTVCVKDMANLLGDVIAGDFAGDSVGGAVLCVPSPYVELSPVGRIVQACLENMNAILAFVTLEKYVIMPNHVHLLVCIDEADIGAQEGAQRTAPLQSPLRQP